MKNKYDDSQPINLSLVTEGEAFASALDALVDSLNVEGQAKLIREQASCLLINLCRQVRYHPDGYISYSRDSTHYSQSDNNVGVSRKIIEVIDAAWKKGLLEGVKGFKDPFDASRWARMKATQLFIDDYYVRFGLESLSYKPKRDLIELRDKDKKKLPIPRYKNPKTLQAPIKTLEDPLKRYNEYISEQSVRLSSEEVELAQGIRTDECSLYRVFNHGSFDSGGRFYGGWWQNTNKDLRRQITINGAKTVEIDCVGQHIHFVYGLEGLCLRKKMSDDPFEVLVQEDSPDLDRPFWKSFFLTAINSDKEQTAWKALKSEQQKKLKELRVKQADLGQWTEAALEDEARLKSSLEHLETQKSYNSLRDHLVSTHPPTQNHLYKGQGSRLMRMDSEVCNYVLNDLTALRVPVLPVHDSFIVAPSLDPSADVISQTHMSIIKAYREVMNGDLWKSLPPLRMTGSDGSELVDRELHEAEWCERLYPEDYDRLSERE